MRKLHDLWRVAIPTSQKICQCSYERLATEVNLETVIAYGSISPRSPTSAEVVERSIDYCFNMATKLGQEFTIVTCDQAIYDIALALQKKKPEKYKNLILRMGGFHIASYNVEIPSSGSTANRHIWGSEKDGSLG